MPPKNLPVRPTTDMSKEALFNVLNNHFNFSELQILNFLPELEASVTNSPRVAVRLFCV